MIAHLIRHARSRAARRIAHRALARLDDHILRDIGLTRADLR